MNKKIEYLRAELYEAMDNGTEDEILKASVALDIEIVKDMIMHYTPNKIIYHGIRKKRTLNIIKKQ
jgi:hypothetical protein